MCMGAIKQARMDKVVYGTKNTKEVDLPLVITNSDVQEKECSRLLKLFFKK